MSEKLQVGDTVLGEVIAIKPYGAFVQLPTGETGMIHISEVAEEYVKDIHDYLAIGDQVAVKVIAVNEEGKYNLSLRQLTKQEEEAVRYFHQAQEFRHALETRREEIKLEATWRKRAKDKQRSLSTSRASLLSWLKQARRASSQIGRKSEERERFYRSLDL
jgi:S1 RNA binding domain protein